MKVKKRGQIALKPTIEIAAAVAIFFLFAFVGKSFGSGEVYQKVRIAEDISLAVDSFLSVPGDGYIFYNEDLSKYEFLFDKNKILVQRGFQDPLPAIRYFTRSYDSELNKELDNPTNLFIGLSGGDIELKSDELIEFNYLRCSNIKTEKPELVTIIPESDVDSNKYEFTDLLSLKIEGSELKDTISKNKFIIEIIPAKDSNKLIIYYTHNQEGRKLACLIYNLFIENYKDLDVTIAPSKRYNLKNAEIGIAIELSPGLDIGASTELIKKGYEAYSK